MRFDSIFFGRMIDTEKPKVIEMVQSYNDKLITLAIGDGANDLGMFKQADIGVGITTSYDNQIARESDYVIGEFKHLKPLMFAFGKECYRRNS